MTIPDREIARAIEHGRRNEEALELIKNWCAHLKVVSWGGVGIVEAETGLHIGTKLIECPHARQEGIASSHLDHLAVDFYNRNCKSCEHRKPVRLPNLLQLVERRDAHDERNRERSARVEAERIRGYKERAGERLALRRQSDGATQGVLDIIERLDQCPTDADARILADTARIALDSFSSQVREHLFQLAQVGGDIRTQGALEALRALGADPEKLATSAIEALNRGDAIETAGELIQNEFAPRHGTTLSSALPSLVRLASASRSYSFEWSEKEPNAKPLLRAYDLFPEAVTSVLKEMLGRELKQTRILACDAVATILAHNSRFGLQIAEALIDSMGLPDDFYDMGSAGRRSAGVLTVALTTQPEEIDALVQRALQRATGEEQKHLFSVYTSLFRDGRRHKADGGGGPAYQIALSQIVSVLARRPNDDTFRAAALFLRDEAKHWPQLVDAQIDTLLGAAALIASDLDSPYSPLLDPRPDLLRSLEESSRRIRLDMALSAIAKAAGWSGFRNPKTAGAQIVRDVDTLGAGHDRLRAALVESLGIVGRSRDGLSLVLPLVYSALLSRPQRVRAAAANAYRKIASVRKPEELPQLLHLSFLALLKDPYVIVHRAAVHATGDSDFPPSLHGDAIDGIVQVINVYASSHDDDQFLAEAIHTLLALLYKRGGVSPKLATSIIRILDEMEPTEAARFLDRRGRSVSSGQDFPDLVVGLLGDPAVSDYEAKGLMKVFNETAPSDIRRLADEIEAIVRVCADRETDLTDEVLQALTVAGAWPHAERVAATLQDRFEDTQWNQPRRGRASVRLAAVQLERALGENRNKDLAGLTRRWMEVSEQLNMRQLTSSTEAFQKVFNARVEAVDALRRLFVSPWPDDIDLASKAETLLEASHALGEGSISSRYKRFGGLLKAADHLANWRSGVRAAERDADRHRRAAQESLRDLYSDEADTEEEREMALVADRLMNVAEPREVLEIPSLLLRIALPLPLIRVTSECDPVSSEMPQPLPDEDESLAFVSFALDGRALATPHVIQPNQLQDLRVEVRVSRWPEDADELILAPVSVEPQDTYDMPRFSFRRPQHGSPPHVLSDVGRLLVRVPQTILSRPLEFTYSAWFAPGEHQLSLEGHRCVRLQSHDPKVAAVTGYRYIDEKLLDIRNQIRIAGRIPDEELGHFLQVMTVLGRTAGEAVQDGLFVGQWTESEFQSEIQARLRRDASIGSALEVHPQVGGGITDLSFMGIRIELKVDATGLAEPNDLIRFFDQTGQYVSGSDRRLGILCALDSSPKSKAPGPPSNDIVVEELVPPGAKGATVILGIVLVRGNLSRPSDLSRGNRPGA